MRRAGNGKTGRKPTGLLVALVALLLVSATTPRSRTYHYVASDAGWSAFERLVQGIETPAGQVAALGIVYANVRSGRLSFSVADAAATAGRVVPGQQALVPVSVHITGRKVWSRCVPSGQVVTIRGLGGGEAWIFVRPWPYQCGELGTPGATAGTITVYR